MVASKRLRTALLRLTGWLPFLRKLFAHSHKSNDPSDVEIRLQCLAMVANFVELAGNGYSKWLFNGLGEADAQSIVDFLHELLEDQSTLSLEKQKTILYFLTKLAKSAQVFPKSFELTTVQCDLASRPVRQGGYASIYRGKYGGRVVGVKATRTGLPDVESKKTSRALASELMIWAHASHPNVLPFNGFFFSNEDPQRVCIVTQWMANGNLSEFLKADSETPRILLLHDIASGLYYLHYLDIVHADLKAANILVSETKRAMLADFGISRVTTDLTNADTSVGAGTLNWKAPELFDNQPPTPASDVWALGCIIHEVLTGKKPFDQFRSEHVLIAALVLGKASCEKPTGRNWDVSDEDVWKIGEACRTYKAEDRPQSDALLREITALLVTDSRPPSNETWKPRKSLAQVDYALVLPILYQIQCFAAVKEILARPANRKQLIKLGEADAQSVADFLSKLLLNKDTPLLQREKTSLLHLLGELARSAQVFPQLLQAQGVQADLIHPIAGSGARYIYKGKHEGRHVCVEAVQLDVRHGDIRKRLKSQATELINWAHLSHQNILPFIGIYVASGERICIVSPWMERGDLLQYLKAFPDAPIIPLLHDIISGLQYLHKLDIIHANLRAKNVFVSGAKRAVLANSGTSGTFISMTTTSFLEATTANANWMAPELLLEDHSSPTKESDIWSFGCTCYEVITGLTPFGNVLQLVEAFRDGTTVPIKPESASGWDGPRKSAWTVAESCWNRNRQSRPTSDKILESIMNFDLSDDRQQDHEYLKAKKVEPRIDYGHLYDILHRSAESHREIERVDHWFPSSSFFQGSHDFVLNNPTMINHISLPTEMQAERVLIQLASNAIPSAMLNSAERPHLLEYSEDTHQALRGRIVRWGRNDREIRRLLWLSGPPGVGKSAIAQALAEFLEKEGLLGAVFFFSRQNNREDLNTVVPTLVYQLALRFPDYRDTITQRLAEDPTILHKSLRLQFMRLIVDPFCELFTMAQHQDMPHRPLLIVLDGLDECRDRQAQRELVQMIADFARTEGGSWLRWMICSRPEPHLKYAFSSAGIKAVSFQEVVETDGSGADKDALHLLYKGFAGIRRRYELPENWPNETDIHFIRDQASGHLGIISSIIGFIENESYGDPASRLRICLRFLSGTSDPQNSNPLHKLDLLYSQILSQIPARYLPEAHHILGALVFYSDIRPTALVLANFYRLDQNTFYSVLRHLHSVLLVPPPSEVVENPIRIHHASFSDYLKDEARSGGFCLTEAAAHFAVATRGLGWLHHCRKIRPGQQTLPDLPWSSPRTDRKTLMSSIYSFSFVSCWKACPQVTEDSYLQSLMEALKQFDFNLLYSTWPNETRDFAYFIRWLLSLGGAKQQALVVLDRGHSGTGDSAVEGEVSILHRDDNPYGFVAPFFEGAEHADMYSFHLRLGKHNPVAFWLAVSTNINPMFTV